VREALKLASPHDSWLSVDQMALAWLLHHPANIVPVLGTHNWERIYAATQAEALPLTREQWFSIYSASIGGEVP
jgi:predicted oxidoreductase